MEMGLSAYQVPTAGQLNNLNAIGYVDSGVVNELASIFASQSVDDLIRDLADPKNVNCLVRYEIVRALGSRELNDDQKAALQKLRVAEVSTAIKTLLDGLLAK